MAQQNKTQPTDADVEAFLGNLQPASRQADARAICDLMAKVSGYRPKMWGASIVGFGQYHYRYESGREGAAPLVAFSPRKAALTLYVGASWQDRALMARLGKFTTGKGCLYLKQLSDVDLGALEEVVADSLARARQAEVDTGSAARRALLF